MAMATHTPTSSSGPSTRTVIAHGVSTWLMGKVASGTPPNGHRHRMAAASTNRAGSATHRLGLGGQAAPTRPYSTENTTHTAR